MNLDSPETWRWIWLVAALLFAGCELAAAATFFFLPFAAGALIAAVLSFAGLSVPVTWFVFILASTVAFSFMWKLGRRLERADGEQEGVGATRWVGQEARVLEDIETNEIGLVRLNREEWRAESLTGDAIRKGSLVVIARVEGTRLVVVPVDNPHDDFFLPHIDSSSHPLQTERPLQNPSAANFKSEGDS